MSFVGTRPEAVKYVNKYKPEYMAKEIYNSCKSNKEIYIVHGANHAENYKKDPEGYENVIVQFVGEHSGAFQRTS